jgi:hypothetical protein
MGPRMNPHRVRPVGVIRALCLRPHQAGGARKCIIVASQRTHPASHFLLLAATRILRTLMPYVARAIPRRASSRESIIFLWESLRVELWEIRMSRPTVIEDRTNLMPASVDSAREQQLDRGISPECMAA